MPAVGPCANFVHRLAVEISCVVKKLLNTSRRAKITELEQPPIALKDTFHFAGGIIPCHGGAMLVPSHRCGANEHLVAEPPSSDAQIGVLPIEGVEWEATWQ
jgi:hypothetical protein